MANRKATTSLRNWKFQEQHVQQSLTGGDFVGSHSCIICATAPRLSDLMHQGTVFQAGEGGTAEIDPNNAGSEFAIPIGVVDSAGLAQDRQLAQIFEIGSKRSYLLSARTLTSFQIARVFYKGPSLLRMLYAYYPAAKIHPDGLNARNILSDLQNDDRTRLGANPIEADQELLDKLPQIKNNPGYDNFIINLDSDLFSQPMGLILYYKDNQERDVGAIFLEECLIQNHNMSISANSVLIAESVTIRCERVVPMKVNVVQVGDTSGAPLSGATGQALDIANNVLAAAGGNLVSVPTPKIRG